jgi:protein subunit release factor A
MNLKDLKIEFFKSSGPGGQHKNKRNMAVRITHLPTGLTAVGQESRSQASNKELALERLKAKLKERYRPRKSRIPTRMTRSAKQNILEWKKKRGLQKKMRRKRIGDED